eukprot:jgi/Astpho2/9147/fgenesh1_pg.00135_%23_11_t
MPAGRVQAVTMAAPFKVYLKSNVNTYLMLLVWPDQTVRDMADMFVAEHEKHLPQYGLFTAGNISLVMDDGGCVIPESYRLGDVLEDVTANMEVELIKDDTRAPADSDVPGVEAAAETMPNGASNLEVERPNVRRGKQVQVSKTPGAMTQKQEAGVPEAADSGLDGDRKENHSMLPSSGGKRKKAVAVLHTDGKGEPLQSEPKRKKRLSTKEDIKARMAAEAMDMLASGELMSDSDSEDEADADEAPKKKRRARNAKEPKSPQSEKVPKLARVQKKFTAAEVKARAEKRKLTAIEKRVAQAGIEDGSLIPPAKKLGRPSKADQELRRTYESKLALRVAAEVARRGAARPEAETVEEEDSQLAEGAGSQSGGEVVPPAAEEERGPAPTPTQVQRPGSQVAEHPGSQAAGSDDSSSEEESSSSKEESSSSEEEGSSSDEGTPSTGNGHGSRREASSSPPMLTPAKAAGQAAIARAACLGQSPVRSASAAPGMVASKMPPIPAPEGVHTAAPAKASAAAKAGRPGQALSGATGSRQAATPQAGGNAGSSSGDDSSDNSSGGEVSEEGSSSDDEDAAAPSSAAKAAAEQAAPGTVQQGGRQRADTHEPAQAAGEGQHATFKRGGAESSSSRGQTSGDSSASNSSTESSSPAQSTSGAGSDASDDDTSGGGSDDNDEGGPGGAQPAHAGSPEQVPPATGADNQPAPAPATQQATHVGAAGAAPKQEAVPQQQAGPGAGAASAGAEAAGQDASSGESGSEGSSTEGEESEEEESGSDEGQGHVAQPAGAAALPVGSPESAGARQAASSGVAAGEGQAAASQSAAPAEAADSGNVSSSSDEGSGQTAAVGMHPAGHHEVTSGRFSSKLSPEQEEQLQRFAQQPGGLRSLLQALEQGGEGSLEGAQPADETLAAPGLRTDAGVTPGGGPEVAGTAEEAQEQPGQHDSSRAAAKGKAAKLPGRKATAAAAGTTGKAAKARGGQPRPTSRLHLSCRVLLVKGAAQVEPPSSGGILDQIAAQPIASWGTLKDLSKVVRRAVQEWVVEQRAARGLKADRGSVYQGNTPPAWWPLPVWDNKQLHTKAACVKAS